ncbi:MAG: AAA-like domain-containing protein [Candidatus Promineifilaceae bacterium]|nr:AAA-like domain-containing protein [Candidatus Promineifilaceae bacterium]
MIAAEWETLVKDALKSLFDTAKLNQHPLTELNLVKQRHVTTSYHNDPYMKARALREVIREGIDKLAVEGENPPDLHELDDPKMMEISWRPYCILSLLPRKTNEAIANFIGLAPGGQYYREQGKAIKMLAEVLRTWEGNPVAEASTIPLAYPSGAVKLDDPFYIRRTADWEMHNALARSGGETITIRGSRQVGKTSLLVRGMHKAKQHQNANIVYFDLQNVGGEVLRSLDELLKAIANWIFDELDIDLEIVEKAWKSRLLPTRKLTKLVERHVLCEIKDPILLAMDEIDRLQLTPFHSDFFGLIRSWHNMRASRKEWDKLSVIMAISTEPYLLIADLNQSPFNVGQILYLNDFNDDQVADLNRRYGSPLTKSEIPMLINLLNGHPYLTRVAFYTMVGKGLSWQDFSDIASSDGGPFRQHLQRQYRLVINVPALEGAMREVVRGMRCSDDKAGFRLMKAGLVAKENGGYVTRCQLYQQYFAEKL